MLKLTRSFIHKFCQQKNINDIPTLKEFIKSSSTPKSPCSSDSHIDSHPQHFPNDEEDLPEETAPATFYLETYGCQMNQNDSEIVRALLSQKYSEVRERTQADIVLMNTCAIREAAEQRIHKRIRQLKRHKVVGILGCMAQRIKHKMFEEGVQVVCGPDAYRDLPRLVQMALRKQNSINVQLSAEETYGDITPVRKNANNVSAFLSIMRGCNNMCSYCIVPFVRGRERSRTLDTILKQIDTLNGQGVKEITLLGQNVNSYHDTSSAQVSSQHKNSEGFSQLYKLRDSPGYRFHHLLAHAAQAFPNIRFRFTSPHPKDFPEELLQTIADHPNICNSIHLPAQSGNTEMLFKMRRNHTRQSYLSLVDRIRNIIPNVGLTTDLMCGFCGETEQQFADTLSLIEAVKYDNAFLFAYSMREKTHAHRNFQDDVPEEIKKERLKKMVDLFESGLADTYKKELGNNHLLLIEKVSKRDDKVFMGRSDNFKKGYISAEEILPVIEDGNVIGSRTCKVGDYVAVNVVETGSRRLHCSSLGIMSTINDYYKNSSLLEQLKSARSEKNKEQA